MASENLLPVLEKILEGRFDAFDLSVLARRHFGSSVIVQDNKVTPQNVNMTAMSGFISEVKRLGLTARWDPQSKSFVVEKHQ